MIDSLKSKVKSVYFCNVLPDPRSGGELPFHCVAVCLHPTSNKGGLFSGFVVPDQNPHGFWSLVMCHVFVSALRKI